MFHASQRDLSESVPIRKTKNKKKGVENSVSQVSYVARNPAGAVVRDLGFFFGGERGRVFFPDRVARGQVKFVVSTRSSVRCAFHRHFITFQTATLFRSWTVLPPCCCKTGRTLPAWLNEKSSPPPCYLSSSFYFPPLPICLFGGGADSALSTSCQFLFCVFLSSASSTETRNNPTAFRNTSERKKGPSWWTGPRSTSYY